MATLHIRPRLTRSGRTISKASYTVQGATPDEVKAHALNSTQFHYSAGKRIYRQNEAVAAALADQDFMIEADD